MKHILFIPKLMFMNTGLSTFEIFLLTAMVLMCIVLVMVAFSISNYLKILSSKKELTEVDKAMENRTVWQKLLSLKPLDMEKDLVMEHSYDGINELDNPTPPWFMYLFYSTIAFAFFYLIIFHVAGNGNIMTDEYNQEIAEANKVHEQYMKKFANSVNENNVKLVKDEKLIAEGKALYMQNCIACHGDKGQGGVGPNLTDEFWLHGGSVKNIFHTIYEGVPEKGMISWKKTFNPLQVQNLVSFVATFKGTKPTNGKEPQGDKYVEN
jgi:cytochrome c oxidase cbb3-type subunit III